MSENNSQKEALSVTPLGGVGEIGSNCTVLENEEHIVIIDYGILFPYEDFFDINYLIASLDSVKKNAENSSKKVSIFITHGHEDHIGAIVHLNQVFPSAEIHAPRFAEKLMRKKLQASGQAAKIINYTEDIVLDFGNIQIHPIQVTHSIPDTFGLVIQEKNNGFSLLFISDFKFDLKPLYEKAFNFEKIKGLFEKASKKICMIDSTNILNTGKTLSESDLVEDLEEIIRQPNRVFVTLFSSNIYRVKTLLNLAKQNNKKVVPIGRSVRQYIESASECGIFEDEIGALQKEEQVQDPLSSKYIYILTGCQGDHFGALRRVANSEHKFLSPKKGDVFLFSSKPIPGNEKKIFRIYNTLTEKGAEIITNRDMKIHASGHPSQQDLLELYSRIKPDIVIPIHGESYFLKKHVDFIKGNQIGEALYLNNFHKLSFSSRGDLSKEKLEEELPVIIHGNRLPIEREAIGKRRKMACNGVCFISVNAKNRSLEITTSGLPLSMEKDLTKISNLVKGQLGKKLMEKDPEIISEELRIFTRNLFKNFLGYKPITTVHIL